MYSDAVAICESKQMRLCSLQALGLGGNDLDEGGARALAEALSNEACSLQMLDLSKQLCSGGGSNLGDGGARPGA